MTRYVHTNIIAKDCEKLIEFYKEVLGCRSIGEKRDLRGPWLYKMTGIPNAHIVGEHLVMPGYDETHPTLEIFSYDQMEGNFTHGINTYGVTHIAFEVDDVAETLKKLLAKGGGMIGELVHADYEDGRKVTFVYAIDIEGNILELQSWNQCWFAVTAVNFKAHSSVSKSPPASIGILFKTSRPCESFCLLKRKKSQLQERLCSELEDVLIKATDPAGVAVIY